MITYNHERWIRQAIESVLCQDFRDLEVVVGDDASTDATLAIVSDLAARDPRLRPLPTHQNPGGKKSFARYCLSDSSSMMSRRCLLGSHPSSSTMRPRVTGRFTC